LRPGFADARAWLERRPVTPGDARAYLREINLGAHLEQLPEELREPFVDAVLERLDRTAGGGVEIGYVRLNIDATA